MPILAPLPVWKFRIEFLDNEIFSEQVESFSFNVVEKKIHITVRETCVGSVLPLVMWLSDHAKSPISQLLSLTWHMLAPKNEIVRSVYFQQLRLLEHSFSQTYLNSSEVAKHCLVLSYGDADTD